MKNRWFIHCNEFSNTETHTFGCLLILTANIYTYKIFYFKTFGKNVDVFKGKKKTNFILGKDYTHKDLWFNIDAADLRQIFSNT